MRGNKIKWAPGLLLRTEDWNANVWDLRSDSMLKIASVIGELKKGDFVIFLGEATLSKVWNTWEIKVFTRFGVGWAEAQRFMWDGITSAAFNRGLDEFNVERRGERPPPREKFRFEFEIRNREES